MVIIITIIWFVLSIWAIYYFDRNYYSEHLFKILITTCILALILNAWQVYDPELNHMLVTIEINPTWSSALLLAFIEGVCITGPIAGILILKEKIKERRE